MQDVYEKEALLSLFYEEKYRKETDKTNGELYDKIVSDLKEEWNDNKELFKGELQSFIHEWADRHTEVYTTEIFKWYSQDARLFYLADDALNEFGVDKEKGIIGILQAGIYMFLESFANEVLEEVNL